MLLAQNKIEIPRQWLHDKELKDINGHTVAYYMIQQGMWPDRHWKHDSKLSDIDGKTLAMFAASNKISQIPTQWRHDPKLTDREGNTLAMILAQQGVIPPTEWQHDP